MFRPKWIDQYDIKLTNLINASANNELIVAAFSDKFKRSTIIGKIAKIRKRLREQVFGDGEISNVYITPLKIQKTSKKTNSYC